MAICVACSSSFHLGCKDTKICPTCLQNTLKSSAFCQQCHEELDLASHYCQRCNYRHGMSNCDLCGYELFKHAAIAITRTRALPATPQAGFSSRFIRRLNPTRVKQVHYMHPYCADIAPHFLKKAVSVSTPTLPTSKPVRTPQKETISKTSSSERKQPATIAQFPQQDNAILEKTWEIGPESSPPIPQEQTTDSPHVCPEFMLLDSYKNGERVFHGISLVESQFSGHDLSGIDLQYSNLQNVNWEYLNLNQANLAYTILDGANFRENKLSKANLQGVSLRKAQIFLSDFSFANLSNVNLSGSDLYASYFQRADLTTANLSETKLDAADLSWSTLTSATLRGASLIESMLEGAKLTKANLENSQLMWANLQDANFEETKLQGASLRHADLTGANFSKAQLLNTDLSKTNLRDVHSLTSATYNKNTQLPVGFVPSKWNMIFVP